MNFKKPLYYIIFFCIAFCSQKTNAQLTEEYKSLKQKYPEASSVRLNDELIINIDIVDEQIEITQQTIEEDIFLDETATYKSKGSVDFSAFFELESIEAKSFKPYKGKYKSYDVEDFTEKDDLDNSFYDDTKSLNFIFPNLDNGSKTYLKYTTKIKNPRFLSPFYFRGFTPIKTCKVSIIADKNIKLDFKEFNTEGYDIAFSKTGKRGKTIYQWEIKNVDELEYEENVPTYKNVLPHIVPIITSYNTGKKNINLLGDVSNLHSWYYSMVKDINQEPTDKDLVALVSEITKDKTSDLEKVRAIYYWTQQNIKYIDFEYALGGFIPREANDVFKKKYGDCKDNSSILYEMLKTAGLEGKLTWIGTRSIPYTYTEVPTPIVDNHMILTYTEGDNVYYLDATGRYLALEMPSSFIQGKEALVSYGANNFKVLKVPVMSPETNRYLETIELSLDEENLRGSAITELSGYYKIDFFNQLENYSTETKLKEYYNGKLQKGNNKFLISSFEEINKYSYDNSFQVKYNFNISDYAKTLNDEIYLNLNLNREISYYKTEDDRENDIEVKYKSLYNFETKLQIPEGYVADYVPDDFTISNPFFDCSIKYSINDNYVTYKHDLKMKFLTLTVEEQKIVNNAIKKVEKQYKETIVLKK